MFYCFYDSMYSTLETFLLFKCTIQIKSIGLDWIGFFTALSTNTKIPSHYAFFLYFQMSADSGQSISFRLERLTKLLYSIEDKVESDGSFY